MRTGALKPDISYAKDLVEAGLGGAASAWKGSGDQHTVQAFTGGVWAPAALGAGFGVPRPPKLPGGWEKQSDLWLRCEMCGRPSRFINPKASSMMPAMI